MGVAATEVEYRCCSRWAFVCSANNDASEFSSRTVRFYRLELHKRTSGGRQAAGNIGCKYEHKFLTLVVLFVATGVVRSVLWRGVSRAGALHVIDNDVDTA